MFKERYRAQIAQVSLAIISAVFLLSCGQLAAGEVELIRTDKKAYGDLARGQNKGYNLLMIALTKVGAEHMSLYGYKRKTTPDLDRWAGGAIVFEKAFSHTSWTQQAATSLFTSLYPYTHKIFNRDVSNILDESIKTLPEILKENNYKTAAFTGGIDYYKGFGHMRGFEVIDDNPNFTGFDVTLTQAKNWLSGNSYKKFFLFIQGYTAHCPFTPPEKFKGTFSTTEGKTITVDCRRCIMGLESLDNNTYRTYYAGGPRLMTTPWEEVVLTQDDMNYLKELYDEQVLYEDSMIGDFLNSLDKKIVNNTIIIIFSEHGERFAKRGRFVRDGIIRGAFHDDVMHIPLIIKLPQGQGKRVKGLVQIIDIMPTIMDLLGIPLIQRIQGKSLLSLINLGMPINEFVYAGSEFNFKGPLPPPPFYPLRSINESIRGYKWKLIHGVIFSGSNKNTIKQTEETFKLYNLQDDPDELVNLVKEYPDITKDLKEKLNQWVKRAKEFVTFYPSTKKVPEGLLEDARKHGYW